MRKTTKQQGFTLIELMIVVAVIGVLATVAVPTYQNYIAKSETASALATLTALKTPIETTTLETGAFPADLSAAGVSISYALGNISLTPQSSGAGTINIQFRSGDSSPKIATNTLSLQRTDAGAWSCTTNNIDADLLPKGCN
ncbi:pilin [Vibrio wakamikoensis]|uniref:Pilin n=1 Tax=Vibrio chaetopteri TaxID=3016528 RepID=A0AAU8BJG9_9VIBR